MWVEPVALTAARVKVRNGRAIDERAVDATDAAGLLRVSESVVHIVIGEDAGRYASAILSDTSAEGGAAR